MEDTRVIEEFENSWAYVRGMRDALISCVPDDRWAFSHHVKFAPIVKQFKHVAKVYGCYIDGLATRKLDMSKKPQMFSGPETKENVLAVLHAHDKRLSEVLASCRKTGLTDVTVELFGMKMGFSEYTHVMIHHDVSHFGIWANYAAFGGFETPETWRQDWKL